ncbi:MAG: ROK family protein [Geobacteraceae bacterium]|nr:ROK family protein [Geobacteraceae bacterium]
MNNPAVISMDIGGTNLRLALVLSDGEVIVRLQSPCRIGEGRMQFLENICMEYEKIRQFAENAKIRIVAVGAGVPGLIDNSGEILSSVNLKPLNGFNLKEWLSLTFTLPAITLNDANAAAVAEHSHGAGRSFSSLLHLTLGTGVGSGLILDNRLWTGVDGVAAEYGHLTVEPDGRLCQCGNHGCLEQYASSTAITLTAIEKMKSGSVTQLMDIATANLESSDVAKAAYNGDRLALECFEEAGRYLGIAAAGAVNLLNPEAIILGGGVAASFDLLVPAIMKEIKGRAFEIPAARVKLLKGELGDNAGIIGAAATAFCLLSSS